MTINDPDACHVCGMRATGIGIAGTRRGEPNKWLCRECLFIVNEIKDVRRMGPFELKARRGGMDAAGAFLEAYGSDLAEYTEEQALELCGVIWRGCADEMRRIVKAGEPPF